VSKRSGFYPRPGVDTAASKIVSEAGGMLLTETVRTVGLDAQLSAALAGWRHRTRCTTRRRSCWTWP
jgi:hypothetical protein